MQVLTGEDQVALPVERAWRLFTPEGERSWAPGWDPDYGTAAVPDPAPGVVFRTRHGDVTTVWVMTHCEPGRELRYARVAPDDHAGTIAVALAPVADGSLATVTYSLTALSDAGSRRLERFAAGFPDLMTHWQTAIARAMP
jgi:Polyketide cyclase / dehydrase and lipid transport